MPRARHGIPRLPSVRRICGFPGWRGARTHSARQSRKRRRRSREGRARHMGKSERKGEEAWRGICRRLCACCAAGARRKKWKPTRMPWPRRRGCRRACSSFAAFSLSCCARARARGPYAMAVPQQGQADRDRERTRPWSIFLLLLLAKLRRRQKAWDGRRRGVTRLVPARPILYLVGGRSRFLLDPCRRDHTHTCTRDPDGHPHPPPSDQNNKQASACVTATPTDLDRLALGLPIT